MKGDSMRRPVNVYGITELWIDDLLECVTDGFGYRDANGTIQWYDGYKPVEDETHLSIIVPYGNGRELSDLETDKI